MEFFHNPFPSSLQSECSKAVEILKSFSKDNGVRPLAWQNVRENAAGLVILTVVRGGFIGLGRFGSGLVVARLDDGSWSAPSAVMTAGAGVGGLIGLEITNLVIFLNSQGMESFYRSAVTQLGVDAAGAFGPLGMTFEAGGVASLEGVGGIINVGKTFGLYGGLSLQGTVMIERASANKKMYGRKISAKDLLSGLVPPPQQAEALMHILHSDYFNETLDIEDEISIPDPVYLPIKRTRKGLSERLHKLIRRGRTAEQDPRNEVHSD